MCKTKSTFQVHFVSGSRRSENTADTEVGQPDEGQSSVRLKTKNYISSFANSNRGRRRSQSVRTHIRCAATGSLHHEIRRSATGGKDRLRRTLTAKLKRTATVTIIQVVQQNFCQTSSHCLNSTYRFNVCVLQVIGNL